MCGRRRVVANKCAANPHAEQIIVDVQYQNNGGGEGGGGGGGVGGGCTISKQWSRIVQPAFNLITHL